MTGRRKGVIKKIPGFIVIGSILPRFPGTEVDIAFYRSNNIRREASSYDAHRVGAAYFDAEDISSCGSKDDANYISGNKRARFERLPTSKGELYLEGRPDYRKDCKLKNEGISNCFDRRFTLEDAGDITDYLHGQLEQYGLELGEVKTLVDKALQTLATAVEQK